MSSIARSDGLPQRRPPGRPRRSDDAAVLEAAVRCFWHYGYEACSIGRLSEATGLNRASLYLRFGDKRGLFLAAVAQYGDTRAAQVQAHLRAKGDAAGEVAAFFDAMIALVGTGAEPRGCLVNCVLADVAGADPEFRALLRRKYDALEGRLAASVAAGHPHMPAERVRRTAALLAATARGLAVAARAEVPADTLHETARLAVELILPRGETRTHD